MKTSTVLAVDDRPDNLVALEQVLVENLPECGVRTASSAAEGLTLLADGTVDCVLLNVQMRDANGIEMCRRLKADEATAYLPVVLITAHAATVELRAAGLEAGADDFIAEPVDDAELIAKVKVMLRMKRMTDDLRESAALLDQRVKEQTVHLQELVDQLGGQMTEQMKATKALRESEEKYRGLFDESIAAVYVFDEKKNFIDSNQAGLDLLGYSREELLGMSIPEVDADPTVVLPAHEQLLSGQRIVNYEHRLRRKNGTVITVLNNSRPLVNDEGQVFGMQSTLVDITERKQAERALETSHQRLQEALAKLKEKEQQIVRQERLRALGQMASGIAHDFNNALVPIMGFSELLLGSPEILSDKERATGYLESINTGAKDAANVVRRLREFYREWEEGEDLSPIDLRQLVAEVVSLTQPRWKDEALAEGRPIAIETELEEVPSLNGKPSDIRELLANLILNAVDAMPDGGTITLGARAERYVLGAQASDEAEAPSHVVLTVTDTGTGMPEDVRQKCLEPFFTTRGPEGTGLGLAMVYGIVRRHGGSVDIESELGQGTTFVIRLPIGEVAPVAAPEEPAAPQTRPLKILCVDDEPMVRAVIEDYLSLDGHTVETAENGREGLDKFSAGKFDLVITDRAMPEMSGDQLAAAIKETAPNKPIIMLTGFGDTMEMTKERPDGVDFLVSKPVTLNTMREAVAKATAE